MSEKPQLDVEMMKRLYDFGGLIAYRVAYVNRCTFEATYCHYTFNEDKARADMAAIKASLPPMLPIRIESITIKFDGAFASQGDGTCS